MANFSVKGRTALVTGGDSGMGLGYVEALAAAGADVLVFDINAASPSQALLDLKAKYSRLGVTIAYYVADVSSKESLKAAFSKVEAEFGILHICVCNAGINKVADFLEMPWDAHQRLLEVNVLGLYHTAQLAAALMIKSKATSPSIILIGSIAGRNSVKASNHSAYSGTKGAVLGLLPAIAKELGSHGIRVNAISPGYVRTPMTAPYPDLLESWKKETMLGRVGSPEDMMGACIFLASDASKYITAHDLVVDGGKTMW
ncbi:uncharacterized protein Z520_03745 [Fonsecaea multimorphosa CBS 102226]|uniref:Uncharacterized protein n=1 Tax=Fonsecaea multimorphosa CBS 102226 TaxID=1442371 RepID=A0A0D2KA62_9EURO|nr:uncharacterized protein Z520_03745 [Fonsecaea multimorphosa CBS 102226]KIY00060.1 hypothetical protein Z520_03745 [Fonsecaea multimorphosa CBS 102226]OAL27261.1 hypothetical protein AYO22_03536 [Fonsecaea multimorphosa]